MDFYNLFLQVNSFEFIASAIIVLCVVTIFASVILNFVLSSGREKDVKKEKKSIVETTTMTLFFIFVYFLLRFHIGSIQIHNEILRVILIVAGIFILMIGTVVNVIGRFNLGKNWANQVKIYKDHTFVDYGVYEYFRHPLYASIIWMFYAASIIYLNYGVFLANTLIFIPFMYYRAKQEERFLSERFKEYKKYQKRTGMFIFKIIK